MLMNQKRMAALAMAFLGLAESSTIFATPVTFYFGGEITRADDANGLLQGGIEIGDSFFGSYTFELDTPDTRPADPNHGTYDYSVSELSFRAGEIALNYLGSAGSTITVANDQNNNYDFFQVATPVFFESFQFLLAIDMLDQDGILFDTDLLLPVPPTWAIAEFHRISFGDQVLGVFVEGDLRLLSVVPEPATGVLALIGGMVAMLRRRKQGGCCACGSGYKP